MKGFYEREREENKKWLCNRNGDHTFPPHFHLNIEVFLVLCGEYALTVGGEEYILTDGSLAVVDSYEVHSYKKIRKKDGENTGVVILPFSYLERFNARRKNKWFAVRVRRDETLCKRLLAFADEYFCSERGEAVLSAAAELFMELFAEGAEFAERKERGEEELVRKMLLYIEAHYREEISRARLAKELGYTETHISRVFHRYIGKGLLEYIHSLRLDYITARRRAGDTRTELALLYEAGFNSPQTYYRAKKKQGE